MSSRSTRAVDIDCPQGHATAGTVCNGYGIGVDLCQARINAAVAITRDANRRARASQVKREKR